MRAVEVYEQGNAESEEFDISLTHKKEIKPSSRSLSDFTEFGNYIHFKTSQETNLQPQEPSDNFDILGDDVSRASEEEEAFENKCKINPMKEERIVIPVTGLAESTEFGTHVHIGTSSITDLQPQPDHSRLEHPNQHSGESHSSTTGMVPSRSLPGGHGQSNFS